MHMRNATLLFLVKKVNGEVSEVCLAMKKRGFGMGRWNGVGGKVGEGESIEEATKREAKEEIGIDVVSMEKTGEIAFSFTHQPDWSQTVHVYVSEEWEGEPTESEEMNPKWYSVHEIPYEIMWPDDIFWVPDMMSGKKIKAAFTFGPGDVILEKEVQLLDVLS